MKSKRTPVLRRTKKKTGKVDAATLIEAGKATQFQPGQSGNVGGRPRSLASHLSQELRRLLRTPCPSDKLQRSWAEVIAEKMCQMALKGNIHACIEIGDRTEGRPSQALSLSGDLNVEMNLEEIDKQFAELTDSIRERLAKRNAPEEQIRAFAIVRDTFLLNKAG
jgi:hypothetical protein